MIGQRWEVLNLILTSKEFLPSDLSQDNPVFRIFVQAIYKYMKMYLIQRQIQIQLLIQIQIYKCMQIWLIWHVMVWSDGGSWLEARWWILLLLSLLTWVQIHLCILLYLIFYMTFLLIWVDLVFDTKPLGGSSSMQSVVYRYIKMPIEWWWGWVML